MKFGILQYKSSQEHSFNLEMFVFATKNIKNLQDLAKFLNENAPESDASFSVLIREQEDVNAFEYYHIDLSDESYGLVIDSEYPDFSFYTLGSEKPTLTTLDIKESFTKDDIQYIYGFSFQNRNIKELKKAILQVNKSKKNGEFYLDDSFKELEYKIY
jgi:hypothetical protein